MAGRLCEKTQTDPHHAGRKLRWLLQQQNKKSPVIGHRSNNRAISVFGYRLPFTLGHCGQYHIVELTATRIACDVNSPGGFSVRFTRALGGETRGTRGSCAAVTGWAEYSTCALMLGSACWKERTSPTTIAFLR